jgi:hypothetical protein
MASQGFFYHGKTSFPIVVGFVIHTGKAMSYNKSEYMLRQRYCHSIAFNLFIM